MQDEKTKKQILMRLKRLNGQIGGIAKMVENDGECRAIIQQVKAARSALDATGKLVLACYLESCVNNSEPTEEAMGLFLDY